LNNWPGYAPLYLSYIQSAEENPQEYQLIPMASSSDVMHGLRSGTLEAGALTLDEAIMLSAEGIALRIVLVFDISNGGDALLANRGIKQLSQLKGKTIALEKSTVGSLVLSRAIAAAGLNHEDIKTQYCLVQDHEKCLADVDAVITFEPTLSQLMAAGAINLFDSRQMPNEIIDVLVVNEMVYTSLRKQISVLVKQYYKTRTAMLEQNYTDLTSLADFTGMSRIAFENALRGIVLPDADQAEALMSGSPAPLRRQIDKLVEFLKDRGRVDSSTQPQLIVDASFLDSQL